MKRGLDYNTDLDAVVPDLTNRELDLKNDDFDLNLKAERERLSIQKKANQDRERLAKELKVLLGNVQGSIGKEEEGLIDGICDLHTELNKNLQRVNSAKEDILDTITNYQDSFKEIVRNYFERQVLNLVKHEVSKKIKIDDFMEKGITKPLETLKENLITVIESEKMPKERELFFTRIKNFIINVVRNFFKLFEKGKDGVMELELEKIELQPTTKVVNISSTSSINITPDIAHKKPLNHKNYQEFLSK